MAYEDGEEPSHSQAKRDDKRPPQDQWPTFLRRCMWCDKPNHQRKEYKEFQEVLRRNVGYFIDNEVHSLETRDTLELNVDRGGMKRLMEEDDAQNVEGIHYSTSTRIQVGKQAWSQKTK